MYGFYQITEHKDICRGVKEMTVLCPEGAKESLPGQFFMLKGWKGNDPFLMRPISINAIDRKKGTVTFLYKIVGKGTELISMLKEGDSIELLGPLGHGFPIPENAKAVAVIGRGIGIAPLRPIVEECREKGMAVYAYLSGKNEDFLFDRSLFASLGAVVRSTTNPDEKVTDFFAEDCKTVHFDAAYSCGSKRLGADMKKLHTDYGFPAYISLEEHMACGVGACKGCICTEYEKETGESHYARVCKSGPVFDVERVIK